MDVISCICITWGKALSIHEEESCMYICNEQYPTASLQNIANHLYLLWDNPLAAAVLMIFLVGGGAKNRNVKVFKIVVVCVDRISECEKLNSDYNCITMTSICFLSLHSG
jgi:hypothetical protein